MNARIQMCESVNLIDSRTGHPIMNKICYIYKPYKVLKSGDVKKLVLFEKIKRHETLLGKKPNMY